MNVVLLVLLIIVIVYLQLHFLSFLNLIMIGLLIGVYFAVENNTMMSMIFIVILSIILLTSLVFKIINVINSIKDFNSNVVLSSKPEMNVSTYLSKTQLSQIPSEYVELDLSKEMNRLSCEEEEHFYAPTKFVDGREASEILDKCVGACAKHSKCSLVVMPNTQGKNDECKFYGTETQNAKADDTMKGLLDKLNSSQDIMQATHYATVHK